MYGPHNIRYCGDFNRIHHTNAPASDQTYIAVLDKNTHREHLVVFTGLTKPTVDDPTFLDGVLECIKRGTQQTKIVAESFRVPKSLNNVYT